MYMQIYMCVCVYQVSANLFVIFISYELDFYRHIRYQLIKVFKKTNFFTKKENLKI